jgi:hypothetical protein
MSRLGRLLALAAPAAHRTLRYPLLAAAASSLLFGASSAEGGAADARQEPPAVQGPRRPSFKEGHQFKVP